MGWKVKFDFWLWWILTITIDYWIAIDNYYWQFQLLLTIIQVKFVFSDHFDDWIIDHYSITIYRRWMRWDGRDDSYHCKYSSFKYYMWTMMAHDIFDGERTFWWVFDVTCLLVFGGFVLWATKFTADFHHFLWVILWYNQFQTNPGVMDFVKIEATVGGMWSGFFFKIFKLRKLVFWQLLVLVRKVLFLE